MYLFCIKLTHVSDSGPFLYKKGILILCLFCAYFVPKKCAYFVLFFGMGEFTKVQNQVTKFCSNIPSVDQNLVIRDTRYTEGFIVSPDFCILLGVDLLPYLRRRFERVENQTEPEDAPKRTC